MLTVKLKNKNDLVEFIKNLEAHKKRVIHAHGCFDMLHIGHIRHLQYAKSLGDILIVSVTSDRFVNKGNNRPIYKIDERVEMLAALQCVDHVIINDAATAVDIIKIIKPTIYLKGSDYQGKNSPEFDAARYLGSRVAFSKTPKFSTTQLIRKLKKCE